MNCTPNCLFVSNNWDAVQCLNAPIETIVLNTGEQIDVYNSDIAFDDNVGKTLYGKVKNESLVGLIIKDSNPEDIEEIKVVFGTIFSENYDIIADNETKVYKINK